MSRTSISNFLVSAKRVLQQTTKDRGHAKFVIGNESADLDSIMCALLYAYLQSNRPQARTTPEITFPVTNIPASDLRLRPELTALLKHAELKPSQLITTDDLPKDPLPTSNVQWTLVDHNAFQGELGKLYSSCVRGVIDHHDDEQKVPKDAEPRIIKKTGSCCSHVTNYCRETWDALTSSSRSPEHDQSDCATWDVQVAKLALGAILIDTVNMTAEAKITEHDHQAVQYLEAKIKDLQKTGKEYDRDVFFTEINNAKSNLDDLSLTDILRKDYKQWTDGGLTLGISSAVQGIGYLQGKGEDLVKASAKFAGQRSLQLFAIMTAFTNTSDAFAREILLIVPDSEQGKEAAERFTQKCKAELKLCEIGDIKNHGLAFVRLWDQQNLHASRKRVAPLLREAMLSGESPGKL